MNGLRTLLRTAVLGAGLAALVAAAPAAADQVILDDLIVDGSICAGLDCVNGESFGFDTLRLKENNLRIKFQDTSSSASFPTNDWQLTANDSSNGGLEHFSIDDIDGGRTPFRVEAGARTNALYVEADGDIGIGTANPVGDVHIVTGNTPTVRLDQDGSSGFTPQTWDVAGNEANFFIRDATSGSTLPIRLRPGAPSSAIDINGGKGDVGLGVQSPGGALHVLRTSGGYDTGNLNDGLVEIESTANENTDLLISNSNARNIRLILKNNVATWDFRNNIIGQFAISESTTGVNDYTFAIVGGLGNLTITGDYFSATCAGATPCAPDYVFEEDYELMPLAELEAFIQENRHLPNVPSESDLRSGPLNHNKFQMALLEKIEELTLYTLAQQKMIEQLQQQLETRDTNE